MSQVYNEKMDGNPNYILEKATGATEILFKKERTLLFASTLSRWQDNRLQPLDIQGGIQLWLIFSKFIELTLQLCVFFFLFSCSGVSRSKFVAMHLLFLLSASS